MVHGRRASRHPELAFLNLFYKPNDLKDIYIRKLSMNSENEKGDDISGLFVTQDVAYATIYREKSILSLDWVDRIDPKLVKSLTYISSGDDEVSHINIHPIACLSVCLYLGVSVYI